MFVSSIWGLAAIILPAGLEALGLFINYLIMKNAVKNGVLEAHPVIERQKQQNM